MKTAARMLTCLALVTLPVGNAVATDAEKEQRWAAQVEANLFDGEMVWLEADGHRFLGILTEADDPRGYVVIAHGTGIHPDWGQVINPLRVGLVEHGWTTLSIQMPVLANDIGHDDYQPVFAEAPARFEAAAAAFDGDRPLYLVAHSLGAAMSTWYLSHADSTRYAGFVGIGMGGGPESPFREADNAQSLAGVAIPVLDLYGESDFESVLASVEARAAAQSGNSDHAQQMVPGANHFFDGQEAALLAAVAAWLDGRP